MRLAAWIVLCAFALVAVVGYVAGNAARRGLSVLASVEAGEQSSGEPVARTASLAGAPSPKPTRKLEADNSPCYVCHVNYEEDDFVTSHAGENVGCVDCHGESYAHRDDEDNITPPDVLYGADAIAPACGKCHDTHDAPAAKVIACWQERCPAKENPDDLVCTDCHGQHRLRFRTVWWDKKTRELVIRGENERVKYAPDLTKKPGDEPDDEPEGDGEGSGKTQ